MLIKKLNTYLPLIINLLLTGSPILNYAQTDLSLVMGNNFFKDGEYLQAIIEYKRFIFFNPESEYICDTYYKMGLAYRNIKNWEKAIESFKKAIQYSKDKKRIDEIKITLAATLIAMGNFSKAEIILLKIKLFSKFNEIRKEASFFLGVNYLYTYQWEKAYQEFKNYFGPDDELKKWFENSKMLKYKSPKLAKILSIVVPGMGQIYATNLKDGINALLVNGIIGYLFVNNLLNKSYDSALINLLFIFKKFYTGNLANAEKLAHQYNEKLNKETLKAGIEIINKLLTIHRKRY